MRCFILCLVAFLQLLAYAETAHASSTNGRMAESIEGDETTSSPSIVIGIAEPRLDAMARRLRLELKSAGYPRVSLVRQTVPCAPSSGSVGSAQLIVISLFVENPSGVKAEICRPRAHHVALATTRGRLESETDFAIVVTEALHGLLTAPSREEDAASAAWVSSHSEQNESTERGVVSSIAIEPRVVLDAPTGGVWSGLAPSLRLPLSAGIGVTAEMFGSFLPIAYSDEEIDLRSHLIWTRLGVFGDGLLGPVRVGWVVSAGPFANLATADAVAPRMGGSDGAFGAILHAGSSLEFPARGLFFARGSLGVSALVPRLRYQMSDEITSPVGELLLEGAVGLGLRWDR